MLQPSDGQQGPQAVGISWETDYLHAMDVANQQQKMLLIFFRNSNDPQSQRLENETLASADVRQKLHEFVCLRLPLDAKVTQEGKEVDLLQHPTLSVSGRRKPAIYERLKTSHPEKEGVCQVGSPVLNSGGILHGEPAHDGGYSSDLKFA